MRRRGTQAGLTNEGAAATPAQSIIESQAAAIGLTADTDAASLGYGTVVMPPVPLLEKHQKEGPTQEAATIPARPVAPTTNTRSRGWLGLAASYTDQFKAWLSKEKRQTLEELAASRSRYNVPENRTRLAATVGSPQGDLARELILTGNMAYAQSVSLLKTFLKYKEVYSKASTNSASRDLLVYTNRLFEDILLYLVTNDKKHKLKTELELISSKPLNNSQVVEEGLFVIKPINLIPWELKDALNEVLRANPEKGKKYLLEAGGGVRELAQMPIILGTASVDDVEVYDAAMQPAYKLADVIIQERLGKFTGSPETGVMSDELRSRIFAQEGAMNIEDSAASSPPSMLPSLSVLKNYFRSPPIPSRTNIANTVANTSAVLTNTGKRAYNAAQRGTANAVVAAGNGVAALGTGVVNAVGALSGASTNERNNWNPEEGELNEPNSKRIKYGGTRKSVKSKNRKSKNRKSRNKKSKSRRS